MYVLIVMMVAAAFASGAANSQNQKIPNSSQNGNAPRPPLMLSGKDNSNGVSNNKKSPKSRIVSSRYMSPSTSTSSISNSSTVSSSSSRSYPSPLVSSNSTPVGLKRSVSVDRRVSRSLTSELIESRPSNASDVSSATKLLVTSTRSLSVSFQGESFSLPISKTKVAPSSPNLGSGRKGTPERRRRTSTTTTTTVAAPLRDQIENSKPGDRHLWPGRNRLTNPMLRGLDYNSKLIGSGNGTPLLQQSMIVERRHSIDSRLSTDLGNSEPQRVVRQVPDGNSFDLTASDSDSASSGSTSGVVESRGAETHVGQNGSRGILLSPGFWQETNRRMRRLHDPGAPLSTSPRSKPIVSTKVKKHPSEGPLSSPRAMLSPNRGGITPASPSKVMTPVGSSPPSRVRNGVGAITNYLSEETHSVLSYAVDVRRGKVGENKLIDAHLLRILYNRHLQWRFVNARTEAVLMEQKRKAEKNLWNAWITISDLRSCLTKKRHRLQLLLQKLKLASILRAQMTILEDWACLDKEHSMFLHGAIEALKASTLRLPVIGAIADTQSLHNAITSALDIMQAMASSTFSLIPLVEEVHCLVNELAKVATKEHALLEQCRDFVSLLAETQVNHCSLRTHILQQHRRWV